MFEGHTILAARKSCKFWVKQKGGRGFVPGRIEAKKMREGISPLALRKRAKNKRLITDFPFGSSQQ
jgi:hypothetical protein